MKEENKKIICGRWFKKGDEDELAALSMLKHRDGTPSVVCFLSQQLAEKYLKALLIYSDQELTKIHDLMKLGEKLFDFAPEIKDFNNDLAMLSAFYIGTRYVGDYPEFSWQDAEEAYAAAKKIKDFVLKKIEK
jgi:HEPN domain-containing protein